MLKSTEELQIDKFESRLRDVIYQITVANDLQTIKAPSSFLLINLLRSGFRQYVLL